MIITENKPRIRQFEIKQQKDLDANYGSCLWATITVDEDRYELSISGDCGVFNYAWQPTLEGESFLKLLCRLNREYLLEKISNRSMFNLQKSIEETLQTIKDSGYDLSSDAINEIKSIDTAFSDNFFMFCEKILDEEKEANNPELRYISDLICSVKEYPKNAICITDIFCDNFQPYLRNLLEKEKS